jgi:hypothetical protein
MNFTAIGAIFVGHCDEVQIIHPVLYIPRDRSSHVYDDLIGLGVIGCEPRVVSGGIEEHLHVGEFSD